MEAIRSSETWVHKGFTWSHIPENAILHSHRRENLKPYKKLENDTNALAVNLLDNSETTHGLNRYTALTLPDRSE
jgi:hypothetical protein